MFGTQQDQLANDQIRQAVAGSSFIQANENENI